MSIATDPNSVGIAFALTLGAGLATVIGAAAALCIRKQNNQILAAALAFAAGIMIYVSLVDVLLVGKRFCIKILESTFNY